MVTVDECKPAGGLRLKGNGIHLMETMGIYAKLKKKIVSGYFV